MKRVSENQQVVSIRIPVIAMNKLKERALAKDIPFSFLARHYLLQKLGLAGKKMRLTEDGIEKIAKG